MLINDWELFRLVPHPAPTPFPCTVALVSRERLL